MGTEAGCGNYYSEPPPGPSASAMAGYYQMSSDESGPPRNEASLTDEELGQSAVSVSDCDTDLEMHQSGQQQQQQQQQHQQRSHQHQQQHHMQHQHAHQHHGDSNGRTNPWVLSQQQQQQQQQLQNQITNLSNATIACGSTPTGGPPSGEPASGGRGSNGNGWSFPNYQRMYNDNTYGIAVSAAAAANNQTQHNGNSQQQQGPQQHSQHALPGPSQHHTPAQQQQQSPQQQQQQPQQQQQHQQQHVHLNNAPQQHQQQQQQRQQQQQHRQQQTVTQSQQQQQQQLQQHHQHQQQHSLQHPSNGLTAAAVAAAAAAGHLGKRFYYQGKTSNNKDICGEDKHKEEGDPWSVDAHSAFLGPNLWDKTLPYDSDLKVHQYADLDEFLSENGIPYDGLPTSHLGNSTSLAGQRSDSLGHCAGLSLSGLSQVTTKRERSPSPSDCMSPETMNPPSPADSTFSMSSTRDFDPRTRAFSDEELKPQPMIKKSRKQFVPDEMKDDKYWARRRKNNMAAKRSRDARRMKENQIALRAGYLEKENMNLHREVEQLKQENMELRARLSKYQEV